MRLSPILLCLAFAAGCAGDPDGEPVCNGADLQTDPLNCGECGASCGGGACVMGQCEAATLVTGQDKPSGIAVDGAHIVWTTEGVQAGTPNGTISECPVDGCAGMTPEKVLYRGLGRPSNPILVADKIYFGDGVLGTAGGDVTRFGWSVCRVRGGAVVGRVV